MTATTREIVITESLNHVYTAKYSDYVDIWTSPIGSGFTREQAIEELKTFEASIARHGSIRDRYPEDFSEDPVTAKGARAGS